MDVESAIQARLADQVSSVPDTRIRMRGDWQNMTLPYIVHFQISGGGTNLCHGGVLYARLHPFYQVSVFGESYADCASVRDEILGALHGWSEASPAVQLCKHVSTVSAFDLETKTHHIAMNFEVWEAM